MQSEQILSVLLAEITRLKQLQAPITEIPVADKVVRAELANLREEVTCVKLLLEKMNAVAEEKVKSTTPARGTTGSSEMSSEVKSTTIASDDISEEPVVPRARSRTTRTNTVGWNRSGNGLLAVPDSCDTHFFLSHFQATGSDQIATLELELARMGFISWYVPIMHLLNLFIYLSGQV
jgi:hypothetical protein